MGCPVISTGCSHLNCVKALAMRLVCRSAALGRQTNIGGTSRPLTTGPSLAVLLSMPILGMRTTWGAFRKFRFLGHAPKTTKSLPLHGSSGESVFPVCFIGIGSLPGVSNLSASLGHTGRRRVVLGHTLNTLQHVITKNLINALSIYTVLCWAAFTATLGCMRPQAGHPWKLLWLVKAIKVFFLSLPKSYQGPVGKKTVLGVLKREELIHGISYKNDGWAEKLSKRW